MPELRFGVAYDFRNPPGSDITMPELYAAVLDQIVWLDGLGLDLVWFTEHHFVEDGYLPSWTPVAGAVAARTERIRFSTDICLLPFNHPLRLAEDLAVLDNLSGGRVEVGIGMGYATHEFRGFGIPIGQRVSRTEEGLEVLKRCFAGERFSFAGRRFAFDDVVVTPGYVQPGGPPLWVAAMSAAGAARAARFDSHLLPQGNRDEVLDPWREALARSGRDPARYRIGILKSLLVTDDPEREWPAIRSAERYRMGSYGSFSTESRFAPDKVRATYRDPQLIPQAWIVGDVERCVDELCAFIGAYGVTDLVTWGTPPGLHPDRMAASLERYVTRVVPRVRERLTADDPGSESLRDG